MKRIIKISVFLFFFFFFAGSSTVKANFFNLYGRAMPWVDNPSWGVGSNSMLNICTDWGCGGFPGFSSYFQRNGNYLPNVPIVAISDGWVWGIGYDPAYSCGNYILINHGNGYLSKYCHLSSTSINPRTQLTWQVNDPVKKGEEISKVYSDASNIRAIVFLLYNSSSGQWVDPATAGSFDGCYSNSQSATYWQTCPINSFYAIYPYWPVKSNVTGPRGDAPWEPLTVSTINPALKSVGYFLPQGYNEEIVSVANQQISYLPHDSIEVPINTATGAFEYNKVDSDYQAIAGVPFEFRRAYTSSNTLLKGMLSTGWRTSFDMQLVANVQGALHMWTVIFPDGHTETFQDSDYNYATAEFTNFVPYNSEAKGTLTRNTENQSDPYDFVYTDKQTGQQLVFGGNRNNTQTYGKLIKLKYPNNNTLNLVYSNGNLISVSDKNFGRSFQFTYDSSQRVTKLKDAAGKATLYEYNVDGFLKKVTNPSGNYTKYLYDVNKRISEILEFNGQLNQEISIEKHTYDSNGRVISLTDANGNVTTYTYSVSGTDKIVNIRDGRGNTSSHKHNNKDYLIEVRDNLSNVTKYFYNDYGQKIREEKPDGSVFTYTYDSKGNRTKITYPTGAEITTAYNGMGKPVSITETSDGVSKTKYFTYDETGNISQTTDALNNQKNYTYNSEKLLVAESTENSSATEVLTNAFGTTDGYDLANKHLVITADVNGDNFDDIIGFKEDGTYLSLGNKSLFGERFTAPVKSFSDMGVLQGYGKKTHPRLAADFNGDGKDDIMAVTNSGVNVAVSNGTGFPTRTRWIQDFYAGAGWDYADKHVIGAGDVNGDGKADLIGIYNNVTYVALSTGSSFAPKTIWLNSLIFTYNGTWRLESHPRVFSDVNGDGKTDIIGFSSWDVTVALSDGSQFLNPVIWNYEFCKNCGWNTTDHTRIVKDVNNDGKSDIIAFGSSYVYKALSDGTKFSVPTIIDSSFVSSRNLNSVNFVKDLLQQDGEGALELILFGGQKVLASANNGTVISRSYDVNGYLTGEKFNTAESDNNGTLPDYSYYSDSNSVLSYHFNKYGNLTDSSPNTNNPIHLDNVKLYTGPFGGYFNLEGGNSAIAVPLNGLPDSANKLTISFWAAPSEQTENSFTIVTDLDDAQNRLNIHLPWKTDSKIFWDFGNIYQNGRVSANFDSSWYNVWALWTFTAEPSGMKIYRNSKLIASTSAGSTFTKGSRLLIIGKYAAGLMPWRGKIDEIKIFNSVLSQSQIEETYNHFQSYLIGGADYKYQNDSMGNRIKSIDPNGGITTFTYDNMNRLLSKTDPKGALETYSYYSDGRLKSKTNPKGLITLYFYDKNGNKIKEQTEEIINQYFYDPNNNLVKEVDPNGNITEYTYDKNNDLVTTINKNSSGNIIQTESKTYNSLGLLSSETDGAGNITQYTYNSLGQNIKIQKGTLQKTFSYDFWGNKLTESDWEGNVYTYQYDKLNREILSKNPLENQGIGLGISTVYDNQGNKLKITDSNGNSARLFYNWQNKVVKKVDTLGNQYTYQYDLVGNLKKEVAPNGGETIYLHDGNNNVVSKTNSVGATETYIYENLNQISSKTDAKNNVTNFTYNNYNRLKYINFPTGDRKTFEYDLNGNIVKTIDELGAEIISTYDALNRKTAETTYRVVNGQPEAQFTEYFEYNGNNSVTKKIDRNGNTYLYTYNAFDKLLTEKLNGRLLHEYSYSGNGNVLTSKDGTNGVTTYTYDSLNRKVNEKDPYNKNKTFSYSPTGSLLTESDFKGQNTVFKYNELENLIKITDRAGNNTTLTYNSIGKVAVKTEPNGLVTEYSYDLMGKEIGTTLSHISLESDLTSETRYDLNENITYKKGIDGKITEYQFDQKNRLVTTILPSALTTQQSYDAVGNIISSTDEGGNVSYYHYDKSLQLLEKQNSDGSKIYYKYDKNGNLISESTGIFVTEYEYSDLNKVTVTKKGGIVVSTKAYDNAGNLTSESDGRGNTVSYQYDLKSRLLKKTYPMGDFESFAYDSNGNIVVKVNAAGGTTSFVFDSLDRVIEKRDELTQLWKYAFDSMGNLTKFTDPNNQEENYTWDILGRKISVSKTSLELGTVTESYEYDLSNNKTKITDPNGNITLYQYDVSNRVLEVKDPDQNTTFYYYDLVGNKIMETDPNGESKFFRYDSLRRLVRESDTMETHSYYFYDELGNITKFVGPRGEEKIYIYNSAGQKILESNFYGYPTEFEYDLSGNLTKIIKPEGIITEYSYNALNQITLEKRGGQDYMLTEYNKLGLVSKTTDGVGAVTQYFYDSLGRLTEVKDALNLSSYYQYDLMGNVIRETDARGKSTTYTYDSLYRLSAETNPLGKVWRYEYDNNGNIVKEIDAKNVTSLKEYDFNNLLSAVLYLDQDGNTTGESRYFTYDNAKNLVKAENGEIANNFVYNRLYNITGQSDTRNMGASYEYDLYKNLTQITYNDGKVARYTYDLANKVTSMEVQYSGDSVTTNLGSAMLTEFIYNSNQDLYMQINHADKTVILYTYDSRGREVTVNNYKFESDVNTPVYIIAKFDYLYDNRDNKIQTEYFSNCNKDNICNAATVFTYTDTFTYDAASRVKSQSHNVSNVSEMVDPSFYDTYTYDNAGNRTSFTTNRSGVNVTINYTYNDANQLIEDTDWVYSYDNNGNRIAKAHKVSGEYINMGYNRANEVNGINSKLKSAENTLETYQITYKNDALGRRYNKTNQIVVPFDINNQNNRYKGISTEDNIYSMLSFEIESTYTKRVNAESGMSGLPQGRIYNVHTNNYMISTPNGMSTQIAKHDIAERTAVSDISLWEAIDLGNGEYRLNPDKTERISYYQRDEQENIISQSSVIFSYTGELVEGIIELTSEVPNIESITKTEIRYDSYGVKLNKVESKIKGGGMDEYLETEYSGRKFDLETNGYYYGSRIYDVETGTWNKLDVYRGEYITPGTRHRYAFLMGNPVNKVDVWGYAEQDPLAAWTWIYTNAVSFRSITIQQKNSVQSTLSYLRSGGLKLFRDMEGEKKLEQYANALSSQEKMLTRIIDKAYTNILGILDQQIRNGGGSKEDKKREKEDWIGRINNLGVKAESKITQKDNGTNIFTALSKAVEINRMDGEVGSRETIKQMELNKKTEEVNSNLQTRTKLAKELINIKEENDPGKEAQKKEIKRKIAEYDIEITIGIEEVKALGGEKKAEWIAIKESWDSMYNTPLLGNGVKMYNTAVGEKIEGGTFTIEERLGQFAAAGVSMVVDTLTIQTVVSIGKWGINSGSNILRGTLTNTGDDAARGVVGEAVKNGGDDVMANARRLGFEGENAVGITGPKEYIKINGRTRIPDRLVKEAKTLEEVKNVKHLNFTSQLKDFYHFSQNNDYSMIIYTRSNTLFSDPLQKLIENGSIIRKIIPGK